MSDEQPSINKDYYYFYYYYYYYYYYYCVGLILKQIYCKTDIIIMADH